MNKVNIKNIVDSINREMDDFGEFKPIKRIQDRSFQSYLVLLLIN